MACLTPGSYAQFVAVPCASCVKVPDSVPLKSACAALLQGLTAVVLTRHVYSVKAGDMVLVHAAAGGTGSLVLQSCKAAGATGALPSPPSFSSQVESHRRTPALPVIATSSTTEKQALVSAAGAQHSISYADFPAAVKRITGAARVTQQPAQRHARQ